MMRFPVPRTTGAILLLSAAALALFVAGCRAAVTPTQPAVGPSAVAPAAKLVWDGSYSNNIQPIFDQKCISCHGPTRAENGLRLDSYEGVMKGTQYGPVVIPGSPTTSALESVVIGTASPTIRMPHGGQRLTEQEVQNITLWIQAGAPNK